MAVAATALEKDLVCEQTKRKGVCDRDPECAGGQHTCGLTSDGFIECVGNNKDGQAPKSKKASKGTFVQVSAGHYHTCGLDSEGFIECIGHDQGRAPKSIEASKGTFVQVSAGGQHTCGLTSKGFIECVGNNNYKQAPKSKNASKGRFVQVSAGSYHTCGLTNEGSIECFGSNNYKQAPESKKASKGRFVQVGAGLYHTCGLTSEGSIECFGSNGDGDGRAPKSIEASKGTFVQVSAGLYHTCGLTSEGFIECVGSNGKGQAPKSKEASKGRFVQVSAGYHHTCGLTSEATIECVGNDGYGRSNGYKPYILKSKAPKGEYLKSGKYHSCERGTYNDLTGQRSCKQCDKGTFNDLTGQISCKQCDKELFNDKMGQGNCKPCKNGTTPSDDHKECINKQLANSVKYLLSALAKQKERTNDLSIRNSRLWQKEQIRLQHDKLMQQRKDEDNREEKDVCQAERQDGTVIFPAIEIENEIEKIEDTTCIDTNRDELLKSFCSFTSDLDNLFQIQNIKKKAKTFWPNICCKERKDKTLEVCEDPTGTIKRENIIPFALSQGGDYSRHNLYSEVKESIKKGGHVHVGMKKLIDSLKINPKRKIKVKNLVNSFFSDVSLCGPRIVDAPHAKDKKKLCELFIPYQHSMTQFYNLIESLYTLPIQTSFLETMERSLRKRSQAARVGKNKMQNVMQMKPKATAQATCTGGSKWVASKLKQKKQWFCKGYNHLDLSDTNIRNVAVHYLKQDINITDTEMLRLSKQLRYRVTDDSCPSPLFEAKDISIQQVAMDALGSTKEWVAVVNLNTQDENGYLQSELPYCENRNYLIGTKVKIEAYEDKEDCCNNFKDYKKCELMEENVKCLKNNDAGECVEFETRKKCEGKLEKLRDKYHNHYSKDIKLTGTHYTVKSSYVNRRRRLLWGRKKGC